MASFLAPYGSANALAVAHDLDDKIERLMPAAAEEGAGSAARQGL